MSYMACNALDYLVAIAMKLDVDANEDGVYLKDGTRWQPSVDWSQVGPIISRLDLEFTHIVDRYQPVMARSILSKAGLCGETHQVAVCNYVVMYSKDIEDDAHIPYPKVLVSDLHHRDDEFVTKYPKLTIDDIAELEEVNRIGVAAYLKASAESFNLMLECLPSYMAITAEDRHAEMVKTVITYYPELISVDAHTMGV